MKMTLWGINEYMDDTLFNQLENLLPPDRYDAAILKDLIFSECGDLYPYYQVPSYLKVQIENFFARYQEQFKRAWDALYSDYNPIENYDRLEAWSDSHSFSTSESQSTSSSESLSTSSSESVSALTSSSDSTSSSANGNVSAFNSATTVPQSASNGQAATVGNTHNDTKGNSLSAMQHGDKTTLDRKRQDMGLDNHRGRVHGNIGTMTTQAMINSSLELANYDIYLWVVILFRKNIISSIV